MTAPQPPEKPITRLGTATAAKSGSTVTCDIDGYVRTVEVARDLTVASGDVLLIHRVGSMWVACCRMFTAAPAAVINEIPPDPQPALVYGTSTFAPVETRSYRMSRWRTDTTDVIQGQAGSGGNNTGAVFYGDGPSSLSGATVIAARVLVRRSSLGFTTGTSTIRLVTEKERPSGAPTLTSSATGPALTAATDPATFELPASWVQSMVDGTAGGLAVFDADGSPALRFSGRDDWPPAWSLTIDWSR